jgi:hypothetical protein
MATQYKVTSDRTTLGNLGDIVSPSDMSADNIASLVDAGHLEPVSKTSTKPETKIEDK